MSPEEFTFTLSTRHGEPVEFTFGRIFHGEDQGKWVWSIYSTGKPTVESMAFDSVCEAQADAIRFFRSITEEGSPTEWASYFREQASAEKRWDEREAA